ncbi:hypothetical protein Taro_047165 [Colocasia esculenta]|uniref:Uncharacterized protein n=1 Tax=Colocasia esculenta TaxID=4460 RepID=A0A843X6E3_COLES|nr:hypothetical protein [Colocasia esculenta]
MKIVDLISLIKFTQFSTEQRPSPSARTAEHGRGSRLRPSHSSGLRRPSSQICPAAGRQEAGKSPGELSTEA